MTAPTRETVWLPAIVMSANDVAISYLSADFTPGQSATPTRVMLHRFRFGPDGLTPVDRVVLDEARLEWPGDYQGLAAVGSGFLGVYGRESDIVATRR